jgi:hypothetical protein
MKIKISTAPCFKLKSLAVVYELLENKTSFEGIDRFHRNEFYNHLEFQCRNIIQLDGITVAEFEVCGNYYWTCRFKLVDI